MTQAIGHSTLSVLGIETSPLLTTPVEEHGDLQNFYYCHPQDMLANVMDKMKDAKCSKLRCQPYEAGWGNEIPCNQMQYAREQAR